MVNPHYWRKKIANSSNTQAVDLLEVETSGNVFFRSFAFGILLSVSPLGFSETDNLDRKLIFDIPRQRADLSLTEFAKQANITLIFPYDNVMASTTNRLLGEYSVAEAVALLLRDTSLRVDVSGDGRLTITTDPVSGEIDFMYKKNKLSVAVIGALSSLMGAQALAQESSGVQEEELIVTGIRGSLQRSMDVKREAGGVVDAISSEDIGKFPDTNLAESLQRITGVSIDRSGGEGQLITVRGFGPQFNTVLVNGRQIASENDTRAFSFDTIAAEMVTALNVHKTSTAAMQSGGVGSTVNIKTARPFDIDGFKVAGSVKAINDGNSEETTPEVSGLVSYSDDKFGALLAVSHSQRETRLNQAQMDGWLEFTARDDVDEHSGIPIAELNDGDSLPDGTVYFSPRNYDHKVTFEERERTNANLVLQFAPSDNVTVTGDLLYSDFDVSADATSYGHWFTASNIQDATTDSNNTVVDLYQEIGLATDMHAKKFDRLTETTDVGVNVDWQVSDELNLNFDLHTSSAEREANNGGGNQLSLIGYANRVRFIVDDKTLPLATGFAEGNNLIWSGQQEIDVTNIPAPTPDDPDATEPLTVADPANSGSIIYNPLIDTGSGPAGVSNHLDESNSRAHVMLRRGWQVEDDVTQLKVNGLWEEGSDSGLTAVKFGFMHSTEEKALTRWDNEGGGLHCVYCGYPDGDLDANGNSSLVVDQYVFNAGSDFLGDVSGSGRMPTSWLAHDGEAQFALLEADSGEDMDAKRKNNSIVVEETTTAFYAEFDFAAELAGRPLSATAGVRLESTDVNVDGTTAPLTELTVLDATELDKVYGAAEPVNSSSDYEAILPNMSVKWDFSDDLVFRMAGSKTLTRPTLNSMSPAINITTTRQGGDLRSESGNPELEPFESDNFDLSAEYYYGDTSYVSVGYFKKDVANFIVNTEEKIAFSTGSGVVQDPSTDSDAVFTNTLPSNGETASVDGLELAVQHAFGETGFGVMANATFVDSNAELDPADTSETFALTGLSDSYNLIGYYEKDAFQVRLAYNWRDQFVQSLTQVQGNGPTLVEEYSQWDLSASYDITDEISVFFEGINLTEEYVHKRGRFDNHLLLIEDSGRRLNFGVRANF